MKKLGLVGGMGPESTIPYYHDIVYGVQKKLGKNYFPNLSIESVNVFEVLRLCEEKKYDELTDYLMVAINHLIKSGADFAALSANTPHIVFDKLQEKSKIPLISIIDATCDEAIRQNKRKLGLLGTIFTMTGEFFKNPFLKNNIEIIVPTDDEMKFINQKISSELELGIVREDTLYGFQRIIERMKTDNGVEAIILGCTELPLLLNDEVSPVPCLDTMKIHIQALVDRMAEPEMDVWEKLYQAAKSVQNGRTISPFIEAGGVGAAILTKAGNIYTGVCIDTASALGMCGERNAVANMITNGESQIDKVVAITPDGSVGAPCGACREYMMQLDQNSGDIEILMDYESRNTITLKELIPDWWGYSSVASSK